MEEAPNSPTSLLHLVPSTAQQIQFFSSGIINEVKNGNESPLRVLIQLRAMEKATEAILQGIKDEIMTAADKYPGTTFELWGNKLEKSELGVKYDYSVCADTVWEVRKTNVDMAQNLLKEREAFLKVLKEPIIIVDEITGEVVKVSPPKKTSTSGLRITIK